MFRNYLKLAFRNIWKTKLLSATNIIGLTIGLAACLLIFLFVSDELSYDRYNVNASRIYRLDADIFFNGTQVDAATSPEPLAPALVRECPQVEQMVRLNYQGDILVKKEGRNIQDHHAVFVDTTFFRVFSIPMIYGDPNTALSAPNSIVIDETIARKYFGQVDVVGRTLVIDNATDCKVTGVIRDIPRQSHFHFSFIRQKGTQGPEANDWLSNNVQSYILARPGASEKAIQAAIDEKVDANLASQLEAATHTSRKDLERQGSHFRYRLMPLMDIHLHSDKSYELEANGNIAFVYIFSIIAILILLIACVNFMNLSTARSSNRAREVGIRKVLGSMRSGLVLQFLTESVLLSLISLILALVVCVFLLPLFNQVSGKDMHVGMFYSSVLLPVLIVLVILVGCIAGSYPAFYLSSFQPIQVLKGKISKGFRGSGLRSALVVFQFSISIALIIGTIVIERQLEYIRNKKVGYDREQVLILHNTFNLDRHIQAFGQEMLAIPGVKDVTETSDLPTATGFSQQGWFRDPGLDGKRAIIMTNFMIDEHYIPTLGMSVARGRNFSAAFPSDSTGVILNETAVKQLGLKSPYLDPLYRPVQRPGDTAVRAIAYHVVGIVKDFNFSTMHENVGPLIMQFGENTGSMALRIQSSHIPALIGQVENKWNSMSLGQPFSYSFMDSDFNNLYASDQRTGLLFINFAVFAIFIACLGLFGLVTYAAEQRAKEISIRKVLGARVSGIVGLLTVDFARLIFIAALIAFPISWWAMNKWLQGFAYRISLSWWIFALAAVMAMAVALMTISFQSIKAALANPTKNLSAE